MNIMVERKSHPFRLLGLNRQTDRSDRSDIVYRIYIEYLMLLSNTTILFVPFAGVVGTTQGGRTQPHHLRAAHVQQ